MDPQLFMRKAAEHDESEALRLLIEEKASLDAWQQAAGC